MSRIALARALEQGRSSPDLSLGESILRRTFLVADREAARLSPFKSVETFCTFVRLRHSLGYKSPDQFEAEYDPILVA